MPFDIYLPCQVKRRIPRVTTHYNLRHQTRSGCQVRWYLNLMFNDSFHEKYSGSDHAVRAAEKLPIPPLDSLAVLMYMLFK